MKSQSFLNSRFDPFSFASPYLCSADDDGGDQGGSGAAPAPSRSYRDRDPQPQTLRIQVEPVQPQMRLPDPPPPAQPKPASPPADRAGDGADTGGGGEPPRRGRPSEAELRAEAAAWKLEASKAEEARQAALRERDEVRAQVEERLAAKAKEFEPKLTRLQQRLVQAEIKTYAVAAGIEDLDVLPLLEGVTGLKVTLNDDGEVVGAQDAIAKFKELKPAFFKSAATAAPAADASAAAAPAAPAATAPQPPRPTGSAAAPAPANGPNVVNVKDMDKATYERWKRDMVRSLRQIA